MFRLKLSDTDEDLSPVIDGVEGATGNSGEEEDKEDYDAEEEESEEDIKEAEDGVDEEAEQNEENISRENRAILERQSSVTSRDSDLSLQMRYYEAVLDPSLDVEEESLDVAQNVQGDIVEIEETAEEEEEEEEESEERRKETERQISDMSDTTKRMYSELEEFYRTQESVDEVYQEDQNEPEVVENYHVGNYIPLEEDEEEFLNTEELRAKVDEILGYGEEEENNDQEEEKEEDEDEIEKEAEFVDVPLEDDAAAGVIPDEAEAFPPYSIDKELLSQEVYVLILGNEVEGISSFLKNYEHCGLQEICERFMPDGRNAVTLAAEMGQRDTLKILYAAGIMLDCRDGEGQMAIHKAVANNHLSVIDFLCSTGQLKPVKTDDGEEKFVYCQPDLNVTCGCEGRNSLHMASRIGHSEAVQLLLSKGADCNRTDNVGSTPLHLAAKEGFSDIVEQLLLNNANVNLQTNEGHTPLFLAAREGYCDVVALLLVSGADANLSETESGWTPLHISCHMSHSIVVEQLIDAAADPFKADPQGMIPVVLAARNQMVETVQQIMERSRTSTSLYKIAKVAQIPEMEFIRSCGVDFEKRNMFGGTALHEAAREGHEHAAHVLLSSDDDCNAQDKDGNSPLHLACMHNSRAVAIQLVNKNAYISMLNNKKESCLFLAVHNGEEEITRCLVASGADINEKLPDGSYPLFVAIARNYPAIVRLLLRNGVETNILLDGSQKPLHLAAKLGRTEILCVLLSHTSAVNQAETYTFKTPLHLASESGHLATVVELIFAQADVNAEAAFGKKPIHLAAKEGHRAIVEVLLDAGTRVQLLDEDDRVDYDLAKHKDIWEVMRAWAMGHSYHRASISGPSTSNGLLPGPSGSQ